jgi:hypothetical protein
MAYVSGGTVAPKRSIFRLSIFSDVFWGVVNFIFFFFQSMFMNADDIKSSKYYRPSTSSSTYGGGSGPGGGPAGARTELRGSGACGGGRAGGGGGGRSGCGAVAPASIAVLRSAGSWSVLSLAFVCNCSSPPSRLTRFTFTPGVRLSPSLSLRCLGACCYVALSNQAAVLPAAPAGVAATPAGGTFAAWAAGRVPCTSRWAAEVRRAGEFASSELLAS